jgi:pSer/pThr/pTyr-binding forkhead associated (FHA) protein
MATLVITSAQHEGRRIEVTRELVIGRENVDVEIDDPELSRRHVAVRPHEGGLEVEDLGSRNGTRVDGTRIDGPTRIRHGAVLSAGTTTFAVEAPVAAPEGAGETRAHMPAQGTVVNQAPEPARQATVAGNGPPPPRRRRAAAPAPAATAPSADTAEPFGRYQASTRRRRRKAATRLWVPQVLTYVAVLGTATGLALYFA